MEGGWRVSPWLLREKPLKSSEVFRLQGLRKSLFPHLASLTPLFDHDLGQAGLCAGEEACTAALSAGPVPQAAPGQAAAS